MSEKPDVHKEIRDVDKNFPEPKNSPEPKSSPEPRTAEPRTGQQGDGKGVDKGVKEAPPIPDVPTLN
jgi:hypothetical protein